jgi:hypothetical protein
MRTKTAIARLAAMMVVLLGPDLTTGIGILRRGRDLDFDFDPLRPASVRPSAGATSGADVNVGRDVSRRLVLWGPVAGPGALAAVPPAIASRRLTARAGAVLGGAVTAAGSCAEADAGFVR